MFFSKIVGAISILASISRVSAHGTVSGIVANGVFYQGYSPSFQFANPAPVVVGWSSPEDLDNGFVSPAAFADPDIICHKGATPGQTSAEVAAGSSIDLQWTPWPESHKGPVLDYLANCNGACETVDKTALEFFKIDAGGLVDGSTPPGTWASDQLIANNNTWTVTIPSDIAPGNYVLRHEIIALHSAGSLDGAQNYPQCINLKITGSGTSTPAGVLGTALYKDTDPGIEISIYTPLTTYVIPGPAVITGGNAAPVASGSATPTPSVAASSSIADATTTPASASSSPVSTEVAIASSSAPFSNSTATISSKATSPTTASSSVVALPAASSVVSDGSCTQTVVTVTITPTVTSTQAAAATSAPVSLKVAIPATTTTPAQATNTPSSPAATSTAAATVTEDMPAGTTFKTLMVWLNEVVTKIAGGDTKLLGKRTHARDLSA